MKTLLIALTLLSSNIFADETSLVGSWQLVGDNGCFTIKNEDGVVMAYMRDDLIFSDTGTYYDTYAIYSDPKCQRVKDLGFDYGPYVIGAASSDIDGAYALDFQGLYTIYKIDANGRMRYGAPTDGFEGVESDKRHKVLEAMLEFERR